MLVQRSSNLHSLIHQEELLLALQGIGQQQQQQVLLRQEQAVALLVAVLASVQTLLVRTTCAGEMSGLQRRQQHVEQHQQQEQGVALAAVQLAVLVLAVALQLLLLKPSLGSAVTGLQQTGCSSC
jgi:hypothetical protein